MRTKFILSILAAAVIAGIVFFDISRSTHPINLVPQETPATTTATISERTPILAQQTRTVAPTSATTNSTETTTAPAPNFTVSVDGSSHAAFAPIGSTVLDAMKVLASTSDFAFTGKDYPSLGFFVDSINGNGAENGYSWILYMNGKLSGTGASQTTLDAGDAIEWRYEKNY